MHPTLSSVEQVRWRGRKYPADGAPPRRTRDTGPGLRVRTLCRTLAAAGVALLVMACGESVAPADNVGVNAQRVTAALLTLDPRTTELESEPLEIAGSSGPSRYKTSFLAVQGKQTDFLIQYVVSPGTMGDQAVMQNALVLTIPAATELVDPSGHVLPRGAAVEVTVYVLRDGDRVEATFGPEGLGFNGTDPALIVTTSRETTNPSEPWTETWATTSVSHRTIKLRRFSNYAVAF